jgi:hypothetical protein
MSRPFARWSVSASRSRSSSSTTGSSPTTPHALVVYRGAVDLKKRSGFDPGTVEDALFGQNGWRVAAAIDCTIRNCRPRSAALEVGSPVGIPDEFTLLNKPEFVKRNCRVAWRLANRIGVQFVK